MKVRFKVETRLELTSSNSQLGKSDCVTGNVKFFMFILINKDYISNYCTICNLISVSFHRS